MKSQELRLGNLIEYKIKDKLDERKEWWEISKVDFQDLTWLDSNPEDAAFRPIKITEEWLLKFGFKEGEWKDKTNSQYLYHANDTLHISDVRDVNYSFESPCKYVHQLQNLYFALTGEELTQVSEGEK